MYQLLLATRNRGKVEELRDLLSDFPVRLRTVDEFPGLPDVREDQPTLEGNALKKARTLHEQTQLAALADDTGLEVVALDGRPGVRSARFAGPAATDRENRQHLLNELEGATDRSARFRTVIVLADGVNEHAVVGICEGRITRAERGEGGFGYDTIFVPEGETRTFAEMPSDQKNAISHRGRAMRQLVDLLQQQLEYQQ